MTLAGSAQVLDVISIADLATPSSEKLTSLIASEEPLLDSDHHALQQTIDAIESELDNLSDDSPDNETGDKSIVLPDLPQELMEIFSVEANEHSETIQSNFLLLTDDPGNLDVLREIRRATHTLKGASAAVGFDHIMHLSHSMEDMMEKHIEGGTSLSQEELNLLSDSADVLATLITFDPDRMDGEMVESVNARYSKLIGQDSVPFEQGTPETVNVPTETIERITGVVQRSEGILRLPLEEIDNLLNEVSEVAINRANLEEQVESLRLLLNELSYSTSRIRRAAGNIDEQIDITIEGQKTTLQDSDNDFDPLELDRYTQLYQLTRELEEATMDTQGISTDLSSLVDDLDHALTRERTLTTTLQDGITSIRLVPFYELETRLRRTVQRTAARCWKNHRT